MRFETSSLSASSLARSLDFPASIALVHHFSCSEFELRARVAIALTVRLHLAIRKIRRNSAIYTTAKTDIQSATCSSARVGSADAVRVYIQRTLTKLLVCPQSSHIESMDVPATTMNVHSIKRGGVWERDYL